jgi:hydroxymethylpyrimidine/phosphomethylpyrimidine kinase
VSAVLVIAGTDSSGGAGLTRDVAALAHFGIEALCAITAVTAQTDAAVLGVTRLPLEMVRAQIAAALATGRVAAVKTGMLVDGAMVEAVADSLPPRLPLIVDPVLAATSGGELLDGAGRTALMKRLLPRATLLTPNLSEAALLLGALVASTEDEVIAQGRALCARGAAAVLMKGGHAQLPLATDWLLTADGECERFTAPRVAAQQRGTGCALATAIAAGMAAGLERAAACARAKSYVTELLMRSA